MKKAFSHQVTSCGFLIVHFLQLYATSTAFDKELPVNQDVATVASAKTRIDSFGDDSGTETRVSIDAGTLETPAIFDAARDAFNFTDDADILTNVQIDNFTSDDSITITNAQESDYSFSNDETDMHIIFNNQGTINTISLTGVVSSDDVVFDQASFTLAMGFDIFSC